MFCVNWHYFQIEFRPTEVNSFVSGPNFAPRKGTLNIYRWITWEPMKLSFSKFQCMTGTSLLKMGEKKMGLAPKLTLPCPPIYGRCPFQRLSSNAHSDQLFSKIFFCIFVHLSGAMQNGMHHFPISNIDRFGNFPFLIPFHAQWSGWHF